MATVLALHIIWLGGLASVALGAECWRSYPQSGPNAYPDCRILSPEVALHWRDEGEGITFAMEVDGRYSWLGLGISEAGGMLAADMAVVRLNASSGAWAAGDYWSTGFERPRLDGSPQLAEGVRAAEGGAEGGSSSGSSSAGSGGGRAAGQDVVLLSAGHLQVGAAAGGGGGGGRDTNTTTVTTAEFWRPLDTCDPLQDMRILRGTTAYVIFAYGTAWAQHDPDHRGTAQLVLLPLLQPGGGGGAGGGQQQGLVAQRAAADDASPGPAPAPGPNSTAAATTITATSGTDSSSGSGSSSNSSSSSGSGTWEVRMQGLEVPPVPTSYLCRHFQVPNPDVKAHVTHWEVLVDPAVSRHVHHMIIYACSPAPSPPRELYSCSGMDANCQAFYLLWAPGSTRGEAPPEAGYALGGDSGVTWVALQVHYTNPDQVSGLVDRSGFRLHTVWGGGPGGLLRRHDMGVLALGSLTFALPPRTPDYSAPPNLCPAACTARLPGPLTLIWSGFHMHTLGKRMSTRWFRDGKELAPLGERRQYSFDYQGASYTDAGANQLLPGDELLTSCSWDSSGRANVTTFGEATSDEMCFNFVSYYPRVPEIELCSTVLTAPTAPPPPPAGRSQPPPSPAPTRSSPSPSTSPSSSSALSSLLGGLGSAPTASCTTVNRLRELTSALTALRRGRTSLLAVALLVASMQAKGELTDATPRTYAPYNPTCKPATFPRDAAAVTGPAASPAHTPAPPAPLVLLPVIDDSDQGGGGGGGASSPGAAAAPTHTASPELAAGGGGGSVYPNGTANVGGSDPPPPSRRSAPPPPRKRVAAAPPPRQSGGLVVASGAGAGAASGGGGGGGATSAAHAAPPPSRRGRSRRLDSAGRG